MSDPHPSEITPPAVYWNRRAFLRGGALAAGAVATAALYRRVNGVSLRGVDTALIAGIRPAPALRCCSKGWLKSSRRVEP